MNDQQTMQEVIAVLERYLEQAKPDDDYNMSIIKKDVDRYGEILIVMGLALIVSRLQRSAKSGLMGDTFIVMMGMKWLASIHSLIKTYGEKGIWKLTETLRYTDEDVASLAAFTLASKEFIRPGSIPHLKSAFQNAEGTGYKIALALALHEHGDKALFQTLSRQYGVKPSDVFQLLAMDMATNGRAYNGAQPWKRKQYRD